MITRRDAMAQSLAIISANCCAGAGEEVPDLPPDADTSDWTPLDKLRLSANRKFYKGLAVTQADFRERWARIVELMRAQNPENSGLLRLGSRFILNKSPPQIVFLRRHLS